jgi:branched-chain amino acid transport system permease protein
MARPAAMIRTFFGSLLRWRALLAMAVAYPLVCGLLRATVPNLDSTFGNALGDQLTTLFIFGVLALALNVAVGYTGLLQLGIAAFFGIGAYITGILTVQTYPFQTGFTIALVMSTAGAGLFGLILGAPTLRLRGDYLAIVTLGFGEVVKVALRNLEEITAGTKGLNPIEQPQLPGWFMSFLGTLGVGSKWQLDYRLYYYLTLLILAIVVVLLRNLEHSRLGRAWIAIREDELAASCAGINVTRTKLASFAVSAALAGLAGCLYAAKLNGTAEPNTYDFNRSITMLCCVILGGIGSLRGTLIGVFLLLGFDNILSPKLNDWTQDLGFAFSFSNYRLLIFGLALVLMMRFRPEGLVPSVRMQHELHEKVES